MTKNTLGFCGSPGGFLIPFGQAGKGTTFEDVSIPLLRSQATLKASLGMGVDCGK